MEKRKIWLRRKVKELYNTNFSHSITKVRFHIRYISKDNKIWKIAILVLMDFFQQQQLVTRKYYQTLYFVD